MSKWVTGCGGLVVSGEWAQDGEDVILLVGIGSVVMKWGGRS